MNIEQIEAVLSKCFSTKSTSFFVPGKNDWESFVEFFDWKPSETFYSLMTVSPRYYFKGGLLQVSSVSGLIAEDTVCTVFLVEKDIGGWSDDWIPFYSFGNGDYYVVSKSTGNILCIEHEDRRSSFVCTSIDDWVGMIPAV